ncbi:MAG TPA: ABC transporter ATP-binding protein [Chloroflexota bacterium]|nr:ABC transporter ATP-binding protein [Chloroflexota bacterium]
MDVQGVGKIYGRSAALRGVTLTVDEGEVLALLGPNGSGKTTLLKILAGAIGPTVGRGTVLGGSLRDRREGVALLAAESYLYDDLTARENLSFAATMAGERLAAHQITAALDRVGLAGQAGTRVRSFSSGMRRRLSLARVALLRPRLLLLDEPYNSLDEEAVALVDDLIISVAARGGVMLATHDAEHARTIADTVVSLDRGVVVRREVLRAQHVG